MDERTMIPDRKKLCARAKKLFERWRLPLLILSLGALLLLWTPGGEKEEQDAPERPNETAQLSGDREQLRTILSSMDGVGRVEVLLTTSGSDETVYQTDVRQSGDTEETTTVFSSGQSAQKAPVIIKTRRAPYLGAVVVCDGADSAAVRLRVVQAVSALTGLGSDKICVIKMKRQ